MVLTQRCEFCDLREYIDGHATDCPATKRRHRVKAQQEGACRAMLQRLVDALEADKDIASVWREAKDFLETT